MRTALRLAVALSIVGYAAYTLAPSVHPFLTAQWDQAAGFYRDAATNDFESRRRRAYGNCNNMGYGYVSQIVAAMPDPESLPAIRYPDWDRSVSLVFPRVAKRVEQRVLVGVEIDESAMREQSIGGAALNDRADEGGVTRERWSFQTGLDFEGLSRIDFGLGAAPLPRDETLQVTLIHSRLDNRIRGQWSVPLETGHTGTVSFSLPKLLPDFSIHRGATDFLLEIERPAGGPVIESVRLFGVKVLAVPGLKVVNRIGSCLTAVDPALIEEAERSPAGPWAKFLVAVKSVH